jgi:hypothetical protein
MQYFRRPHYEDGRTLNEKRFDTIEKLPHISTNSGYVHRLISAI